MHLWGCKSTASLTASEKKNNRSVYKKNVQGYKLFTKAIHDILLQ